MASRLTAPNRQSGIPSEGRSSHVSMYAGKCIHPRLSIYLFGRLEFWRGSEVLPPLATHKSQSLLAYLVLHRHQPHSRDQLAALFWGDRDDVHVRHSLATALWRIRRLLGEGYLLTDSTSVQFNPDSPFWLDVAEFERHLTLSRKEPDEKRAAGHWRQAVDLYRNDLLEGFYDDWCLEERYHLEALYLDILRRLVVWHEAQGDAEATLTYAQRYLAHDPLTESVHLAAMRAFVASGDLGGARRQWQLCCETRQQELHAPPSPEMAKQAESILGAHLTIPLPVAPAPVETPLRLGSLERPPFVGRARIGRTAGTVGAGGAGTGRHGLDQRRSRRRQDAPDRGICCHRALARWNGGVWTLL